MRHKNLYPLKPLAAAVSAVLVTPVTATAQDADGGGLVLEEVLVTARKRTENMQDIPASVMALPESVLKDMGALKTEDYVRFLPGVTWRNQSGGGDTQIIFRGINTGTTNFIAKASSSVYLDEAVLTATNGSQPDLRMMDVARIEALSGPQGTLFGAAAQAGTLRVITNQPDPSAFEANFDTTLTGGSDSDSSYSVTGMVNIPIVEDVFAIRIAVQKAEDGGYIDNVLGNTPDMQYGQRLGQGQNAYWGADRFQEWGSLDNSAVAEDNWNTVEYETIKIGARWDINDNWSTTLTYNHTENEANAGNDYNPDVGDLETVNFYKNEVKEEWDLTSLVIEGDLGFAQFVSATSFFEREYDYQKDATLYYKYWFSWNCKDVGPANQYNAGWSFNDPVTGRSIYYPSYCIMGSPAGDDITQVADFIGIVQGPSWQERFSQEIRLSHTGESFDWLAGLYYEDSEDNWDSVWMKSTNDYQDTASLRWLEFAYDQSFPDAEYQFLATDRTDWEQKAAFGEVTWHINQAWDVTLGGRWFETENTKSYLKYHAGHTLPGGKQQGGVIQSAYEPGTIGGTEVKGKIDEFVPKFAVRYTIDDNKMLYALYTEGFRTGGINRAHSSADWSRTVFPQTWEPDKLKNYEIGAKTVWLDGALMLNLTAFHMAWEDFQIEITDPSGGTCVDASDPGPCQGAEALPWLKVVGNAGDAISDGFQAELAWIPAEGWDVGANALWLKAEIDEDLLIDAQNGIVLEKGTSLPNVPDFKAAAWASYSWPVDFIAGGQMVVRAQASHVGDSFSKLLPTSSDPGFDNPSSTIADVRLSLISDSGGWQVDLFANNITDDRADIHNAGKLEYPWGNSGQYANSNSVYTNRPREYGMRFFKRWGG